MTMKRLSYFPGCSLATTAKENNASLISFLEQFDVRLDEVPDWNCCGSSSTHSVNSGLALALASRNLFLAPADRPLLVACPGCHLRLGQARLELMSDHGKRQRVERHFNREFKGGPRLLHFFELLSGMGEAGLFKGLAGKLNGLKIAPYYGCMLARPPRMNTGPKHHGLIEKTMTALGAEPLLWPYYARCCGTFLSVSRPKIAETLVNRIMAGAIRSGAECIVTACAMCHLNLEIRCHARHRIPVLHFSEILALALGGSATRGWFRRHLIDPGPVLAGRGLCPSRAGA